MTEPMNDDERKAFLASLGVAADGPSLAAEVAPDQPAKAKKAKKDKEAKPTKVKKAKPTTPEVTIDPHTIPAADIVFSDDLIDGYDLLDGAQFSACSTAIFGMYKSPRGTNKDRNSLLHRRITEFLQRHKRRLRTGGFVTDRVQVSQEVDDLAQLLQQHKIRAADLGVLLKAIQNGEAVTLQS